MSVITELYSMHVVSTHFTLVDRILLLIKARPIFLITMLLNFFTLTLLSCNSSTGWRQKFTCPRKPRLEQDTIFKIRFTTRCTYLFACVGFVYPLSGRRRSLEFLLGLCDNYFFRSVHDFETKLSSKRDCSWQILS